MVYIFQNYECVLFLTKKNIKHRGNLEKGFVGKVYYEKKKEIKIFCTKMKSHLVYSAEEPSLHSLKSIR